MQIAAATKEVQRDQAGVCLESFRGLKRSSPPPANISLSMLVVPTPWLFGCQWIRNGETGHFLLSMMVTVRASLTAIHVNRHWSSRPGIFSDSKYLFSRARGSHLYVDLTEKYLFSRARGSHLYVDLVLNGQAMAMKLLFLVGDVVTVSKFCAIQLLFIMIATVLPNN
jgi:hypothetical protein